MDRIESMLGLATRAGRTVSGLYLVKEAVCGGKARLVIVAEDAEANTRKTLENKCSSYQVPIRCHGSKETLGAATGREYRSCAAVLDAGFAQSLMKLLDSSGGAAQNPAGHTDSSGGAALGPAGHTDPSGGGAKNPAKHADA